MFAYNSGHILGTSYNRSAKPAERVEIGGRREGQPLTGRRAVTSPHRTGQLQFVTRPGPGKATAATQTPRLQSFPAENPSPRMGSSSRFPAPPPDPAHPPAAQGNAKPETPKDYFHQDVKHLKQIRRDLKVLQMFNCLNEKLFLLQQVVTESWKMLQMDKCYYHYLCTSRFFQWLPERIPFVYRRTMCRPSLCRSVRRCCTRSCWESLQ
ncbi:uncharacterized protein LOC132400106 [Hypanus sabinus]|uniref:uncharacterized protein LOC132400106 n=1 Tax=Hypanus sabinus TaxID=79690 RepID=UPI0028C49654|nr:uncharacterized protein LOC132400106 [Hypanus sabinus]